MAELSMQTPGDVDAAVERARALIPTLRERAQKTSEARTVPNETIEDFWKVGLFGMLRPKRFGGPGVRFDRLFPIVRELARGDGSAGWVGSVVTSHDLLVSFFSYEGQKEVWDNPRSLTASSLAPMGKTTQLADGVELNGRWQFCSGIDHCNWIVVGAMMDKRTDNNPISGVRYCLVPVSAGAVVDDRHVLGLQGTGSKTFVADKLFVPTSRVVTGAQMSDGTAPGREVHDDPLYGAPMWAMLPFFIAAPSVGIALGALDEFVEVTRPPRSASAPEGEAPLPPLPLQLRASEASALVDAAELLFTRSITETGTKAAAGVKLSLEHRARSRRDQAYVVHLARQAVRELQDGLGGRAIYLHGRVQRALRDLQAAGAHVALNFDNAGQTHARVLFGGQPIGLLY